ncbi:hypothetical protein ASC58_09960 [Phycicoccus sp. Root101]|nr:hypothetical protein ASC58_09960 [Phycicoccus sp. Root101]
MRATALAGAAIGATSAAAGAATAAPTDSRRRGTGGASKTPTVVLAHGAFAESSSWDTVVTLLKRHRLSVVSAAVPLRGVAYDAAYISDLVATVSGPVILGGHSYGGSVISNVDRGSADIRGLVYVAGFAPAAGESAQALSSKFPGSTLAPTLTFVNLRTGGRDLYIEQAKYRAQFCADLDDRQSAQMAAGQRPILESALSEPAGPDPLWKGTPSWFIFGELDRNIPAAAHRYMAERAHARQVVEVVGASHVVGISHPYATAKMILRAAHSIHRNG